MADRRSNERLQVDAHLADLEAEMEAGARALQKLEHEASRVDRIIGTRLRQAAVMGSLLRQIRALREYARQQRTILRDLRRELRGLRAQAQSRRA